MEDRKAIRQALIERFAVYGWPDPESAASVALEALERAGVILSGD